MKRISALLLAVGLALVMAGTAQADLPEHPHALVLGVEFNEEGYPISAERCVDLAANNPLTLRAHHSSVHVGTAGYANLDVGITKAGHAVVPLAPLTPWADCEELFDFFGF